MLNSFVDGISQHNESVMRNVESVGLHIQHESNYSYTVGMGESGLPEIIAYRNKGDNLDHIGSELKELYNSLLESNTTLPRCPSLVKCSDFDEADKRDHFYSARIFYGNWDFDVLQVEFKK